MKYFYGIYLKSTKLATALDMVRFLSEPDSIRFSHITIRGPTRIKLSKTYLKKIHEDKQFDWKVVLVKPSQFLENGQFTVFIHVELGTLKTLLSKRDFQRALPHLTLYDGNDEIFAARLYDLLCEFDWNIETDVSVLRKIDKKSKLDEVFLPSFVAFEKASQQFISNVEEVPNFSVERRLRLIRNVLSHYLPEFLNNRQRA